MKNKFLALSVPPLLCSCLTAVAAPVTFQAEMGYQASLGNFTPGAGIVEVRGPFNGWSAGYVLTNVPSTTLYQNTFEVAGNAGSTIEYKFRHTRDGSGDTWEDGVNRRFDLTGSAQTVNRHFDDVYAGGTPVEVTFQVDLLPRILAGTFTIGTDKVEARGMFQSGSQWSAGFELTNSPAASNIFTGTYSVDRIPTGNFGQYKFVVLKNGFDAQWESGDNRWFIMPTTPTTLPVVYFNREQPQATKVTFQVDLSFIPNFDTAYDTVEARGSFLASAWSGGFTLTNNPAAANTNIFSGTYEVFHAPGTAEEYKFFINWGLKDDQWESINNRSFVLGTGTQTLPVVFFNNAKPSDLLSQDTYVTFRVSMTNALTYPGGIAFNPVTDTVYLNGSFIPWWTWNQPPQEYRLTNDVATGNQIYTATLLLEKGASLRLVYKYGINGADNEAPMGEDHVRYIRALGNYTLPLDQFGARVIEEEVGSLSIGPVIAGQVSLTWNGRPGVHLQSNTSFASETWQDVPGTEGASSKTVPVTTGHYFRLIKP